MHIWRHIIGTLKTIDLTQDASFMLAPSVGLTMVFGTPPYEFMFFVAMGPDSMGIHTLLGPEVQIPYEFIWFLVPGFDSESSATLS